MLDLDWLILYVPFIVLGILILYFVIKTAVKKGIIEAHKEMKKTD